VFSQTAEYALRAVAWLAQHEGAPQTAAQIARATQSPLGYLNKVLQSLGKAGVVRAARGKHGGFELAVSASRLTILEVVNAVDPVCRIATCPLGLAAHHLQLCPLHKKMDEAIATVEQALGAVTFDELMGEGTTVRPLCDIPVSAMVGVSARI
jgi:Rrf2 family protein